MLTLSPEAHARACTFIQTHARPLEQALYAYHFEHGPRDAAISALVAYQNPDGGFGHGLEPDLRMAGSSVLATSTALHHIADLGLTADHALVQGALRFLRAAYDPQRMIWPIIPPNTDDAPHAPWWTYDGEHTLAWSVANPRPELAAALLRYAPSEVPDGLLGAIVAQAEDQPDHVETHDNLICLVRLAASDLLPDALQVRLLAKLHYMVTATLATDPAAWSGYVLTPLKLFPGPDALFAEHYAQPIAQQLDLVIGQQGENGAWSPVWTWGSLYPDAWPVAQREWEGVLTLGTLKTLRAFGRLA